MADNAGFNSQYSTVKASEVVSLFTELQNAQKARGWTVSSSSWLSVIVASNQVLASSYSSFKTAITSAPQRPGYRGNIPHTPGQGGELLTQEFNRLRLAVNDIKNNFRCRDCYAVCSNSCSGGCINTCSGGCNNTCTGCGNNCTGNCVNGCSGGCSKSCTSTCSGGCSGCGSGCSGGCSGSCGSGCSGGCSGSCGTSCTGSCSGGCSTGCSSSCYGGCTVDCANSCSGQWS